MTPQELQQRLAKASGPEEMIKIMEEHQGFPSGEQEESIEQSLLVTDAEEMMRGMQPDNDAGNIPAVHPTKAQSINRGKAVVEFETSGRFGSPEIAYFGDYTHSDLTSLALCRHEDKLENVVFILDRIKNDPSWKVEDLLIEEFLEVLLTMKKVYNTTQHNHRWFCDCQNELPETERKASEFIIDLNTIKYVSIQECDENIRKNYSEVYNTLSEEEWTAFLERRYPDHDDARRQMTRQEYIDLMEIRDSISVYDDDGNVYVYRFNRVKDVLKGLKIGGKEWNWRLREIRNKSTQNSGREKGIVLYERSADLEKLESQKAEAVISATRGLSLVAFNGREVTSDNEKIKISRAMSRAAVMKYSKVMSLMEFGVNDERDITCNLCGKTERGFLQRTISPLELLPIALEPDSSGAKHRPGDRSILDVFVC